MDSSYPDAQSKNFLPSIAAHRSEYGLVQEPHGDRRKAAIRRILNRNASNNMRYGSQLRVDTHNDCPPRAKLNKGLTPATAADEALLLESTSLIVPGLSGRQLTHSGGRSEEKQEELIGAHTHLDV